MTNWQQTKKAISLSSSFIAALLAQMGMAATDTLMLGRLGAEALGGGALSTAIFSFFMVVGLGICLAGGSLMARAFGAKQYQQVTKTLQQVLWLCLFYSLPCLAIFWSIPNLLPFFQHDLALVRTTRDFLHIYEWTLLPELWFISFREYVVAVSSARIVMIISVTAIPLNALLNYLLMYGKFGLPNLGLQGIAFSTLLVSIGMLLALVVYTRRYTVLSTYNWLQQLFVIQWQPLKKILQIGFPISISLVFEIGLFSLTSVVMSVFGSITLAAHQIALQCAIISFMIPLGISQATAVLVGRALGDQQPSLAFKAAYAGIFCGFTFAACIAAVFWFFPNQIANLFIASDSVNHSKVIGKTVIFLHIAAIFQVFDAIQIISNGALRGMKDTFIPMLLSLFSYWGCGLAVGCALAFYTGLGGTGMWWGLALGVTAAAIFLHLRFHQQIKKLLPNLNFGNEDYR